MGLKDFDVLSEFRDEITLLLPLILEGRRPYELIYSNLKGIYCWDTNNPQWGDKIILLYESVIPPAVLTIYNKSSYKYTIYKEQIDSTVYYIMAFVVPPQFKRDYENIIDNINGFSASAIHTLETAWPSMAKITNRLGLYISQLLPKNQWYKVDKTKLTLNLNKVPL